MPEVIRIIIVGLAGIVIGITFGYVGGFDRGYKKGYEWAGEEQIAKNRYGG